MAKRNGAQRESGGVVVARAKRPDFGHAGDGAKREGMTGTPRSSSPDGHQAIDKVQRLQRRLYVAAKRSPERRFHALFDRIWRSDVLQEAWERVRSNRGAAGVDRETLVMVEEYGTERMLQDLQDWLRAGRYHPSPVRRRGIPKPDGGVRPLGIPTVRDRVVQQAAKLVLEPIFEADFLPSSYGYRPQRSATQALERIRTSFIEGYAWVLELDIRSYLASSTHYPCPSLTSSKSVAPLPKWFFGNSIRRPLRRPTRRCKARSSPRFTRCNTVCLDTFSAFIASHIVTQPAGASSTNCAFTSLLTRICQGAPGVACSAGMKPSLTQRWSVDVAMSRTLAALASGKSSPST